MKCEVCKKEAQPNSIVCSERCQEIRLAKFKLTDLLAPTRGCDNCWGDLHQGCTDTCRNEFTKAVAVGRQLWKVIKENI